MNFCLKEKGVKEKEKEIEKGKKGKREIPLGWAGSGPSLLPFSLSRAPALLPRPAHAAHLPRATPIPPQLTARPHPSAAPSLSPSHPLFR
jgi:hypothetical protein